MTDRDREIFEIGEVYLELLKLDLDDSEAILGFANRFGPLNVAWNDFELLAGFVSFRRFRESLFAARSDASDVYAHETIEEFRYGARCIRDLATGWRWLQAGTEQERPSWEAVRGVFPLGERIGMGDAGFAPTLRDEVQRVLSQGLGSGLKPFHPIVGQWDEPVWLVGVNISLYAVCCLEIYNHVVEEAEFRVCRRCGSGFVRQRGRAQHRRHRLEGVIYCCVQCARAEAAKAYRARKRAQKRRPKPPSVD